MLLIPGFLGASRRSPHTLRAYRSDLESFVSWLDGEHMSVGVDGAAEYLRTRRAEGVSTRERRACAIRQFLTWSTAQGHLPLETLSRLKEVAGPARGSLPGSAVRARPRQLPTRDAVVSALAAIPLQADRDQLIFGLLAHLGLRPGEVLALRLEDFDERSETLAVRGAARARRVLVDDRQILMRLVSWRREHGSNEGLMFVSPNSARPMTYEGLRQRWQSYCKKASVTLTLGDLSLSHAAALIAAGVPESIVLHRLGRKRPLQPPELVSDADADAAVRAWRAGLTDDPMERRSPRDTPFKAQTGAPASA
jgi:integrase/recombinase XerD